MQKVLFGTTNLIGKRKDIKFLKHGANYTHWKMKWFPMEMYLGLSDLNQERHPAGSVRIGLKI